MKSLLAALDEQCRVVMIDPHCGRCRPIMNEFLDDSHKTIYLDCSLLNGTVSVEDVVTLYPDQIGSLSFNAYDFLIMDLVDCLSIAQLTRLLNAVLQELKDDALIVLFGRAMPYELMFDPDLQHIIQIYPSLHRPILGASEEREGSGHITLNPSREDHNHHRIIVRAFMGGRVWLDGQPVDNWGGVLPRNLFFYLIDRGMAHRTEIFETFWPDLSRKEATNVFHVTKRKIHEHLKETPVIEYKNGYYTVASSISIYYDVYAFQDLIARANVAEGQERIELMQAAIDIANNRFLDTIDQPWVSSRRTELEQQLTELIIDLGKAHAISGQMDHALGLFIRALSMNLSREDVAKDVLKIYLDRKQPASALNVYSRVDEHLQASFGIPPQKDLRDLRDQAQAMLDAESLDADSRDLNC